MGCACRLRGRRHAAIPWADRFHAVVCWFTSFGYFDDEQNRAVLAGVHRALRPGGSLLLELNHKDGLLPHFVASTVQELDGDIQLETHQYDPQTSRANRWRVMIRDDKLRRAFFFTRLFSFTELRDWLLQAGFETVRGYAGDGGALTARSPRMILVATKARV
jgi:SAM-dependent methyltransferase